MMRDKILLRVVYDFDQFKEEGLSDGLLQARDLAQELEMPVVLEYRQKAAVRVMPDDTGARLLEIKLALLAQFPRIEIVKP